MASRAGPVLLGLSLLVLAGCGRHPAQQSASQASGSAPAPAAAGKSYSLFSTVCPQVPGKDQVQNAIKSAMVQIYGTDETSARFTVTRMTPTDCKNLVVAYESPGASANTTLVYGDDEAWYVTLFGKRYPVR